MTGPRTIFSLDLRSLAVFRLGLGFLVMLDVLMRSTDLAAHYTDFGILPTSPYLEQFANRLHVSLNLANGSFAWAALLATMLFLAGLCLFLGYRTRLATVVAWVLLVSLHNRNPMVLNGGDVLFRLLLFWSMFLPLGARYGIDRALSRKDDGQPEDNSYFGGPSVALTLQLVFVYATTAALKSGKEWWPDGTANYYALAIDQFTTSFGVWLSQWYDFLRVSTYRVFALEVAAPFLLVSPFLFPWARTLTVLALIGMHLNFDLTMRLGIFPWVDMVALVAVIPTATWDWIAARMQAATRPGLRVFYDGDCGFCRKSVLILREFFLPPETVLAPAAKIASVQKAMEQERSWVVVDSEGKQHLRYAAFVAVLEHTPCLGSLLRRLPLRFLHPAGDRVYRAVAGRRRRLGALTSWLLPYGDGPSLKPTWPLNLVTLFFIGYVGLWNLKTIPRAGVTIIPPWDKLGPILRLDQTWNMFAPSPLKDDGWFVIDGLLAGGRPVDVMKNQAGPVSDHKPQLVSAQHANVRWRKYMMNINNKKKKGYRLYLGRYLCRSWNTGHPYEDRLQSFEIVFMKEKTLPYGQPLKTERISLWRHDCFKRADEPAVTTSTPAATSTEAPEPEPADEKSDESKAPEDAETP